MMWKSMIPRLKMPWMQISLAAARPWPPRFRNIERTFRFIEKSKGFSPHCSRGHSIHHRRSSQFLRTIPPINGATFPSNTSRLESF